MSDGSRQASRHQSLIVRRTEAKGTLSHSGLPSLPSRLVGSILFPSVESGLQHEDVVASRDPQCECGLS